MQTNKETSRRVPKISIPRIRESSTGQQRPNQSASQPASSTHNLSMVAHKKCQFFLHLGINHAVCKVFIANTKPQRQLVEIPLMCMRTVAADSRPPCSREPTMNKS